MIDLIELFPCLVECLAFLHNLLEHLLARLLPPLGRHVPTSKVELVHHFFVEVTFVFSILTIARV